MTSSARRLSVAVVGATGVVGTEFFRVLEQRDFPLSTVKALASERSAGKTVRFRGQDMGVEPITDESFRGVDLALFSAGSGASRRFAPAAARAGALVVDNSSAWRMEPDVPLVVPEVNPDDIATHRGIIANPNCCTIPVTVALGALRARSRARRLVVATYQSASGAGQPLVDELAQQLGQLAAGEEPTASVYPHPLVHNVVPGGWPMEEGGFNEEEIKLVAESRKILHRPDLKVVATCVRVPVPVSHGEAVFLETEEPLSAAQAREIWSSAPGIVVMDEPASQVYPTPMFVTGKDEVFIGRIRDDPSAEHGIAFWVVSDNLRKGAALNAVQIAEEAMRRGVL